MGGERRNGQPPNFMRDDEIPEGTAIIRLLVLPPHGLMKLEAHGLTLLDVNMRLAQATASTERELICSRMEEKAAERARRIELARDLPRPS
jgi:hypothetical protein